MAPVALTPPPFRSWGIAAFLLSPIACIVAILTGSALAGVAAALLSWTAWNWPAGVLMAIVAAAPVARSGHSAALPPALIVQAKMAAALILALLWAARRAASRQNLEFPRWLIVFLCAWLFLTALAALHGVDGEASLRYTGLTMAGVSIFCVTFHLARRRRRQLLWAILAIGGLLGGLVLLQYAIVVYHVAAFLERYIVEPRTQAYFSSNMITASAGSYRPSGTLPHPNEMGLYFALLIPFSLAFVRVRSLRRLSRWLLGAVTVVMAMGLYATDSRAAAVCACVALAYLGWHAGYRRWMAGAAAIGILSAGIFLAAFPSSREALLDALSAKARIQYGLSGRLQVWKNAVDLIHEAPLLGVGPGNFSHQYVSHFGYFIPNDTTEQEGQIWGIQTLGERFIDNFHAHNIYLQMAAELGVGGPLLFFIGALAVMIHCERRSRSFALGSLHRALALATASGAAGLLVYGFFDSQLGFTIGSLNLLAAALLAMGLAPLALPEPGRRRQNWEYAYA